MEGECGLLFTDKSADEILKYFATSKSKTFARGGVVANETVVLKAGTEALTKFHGSMEPHLRSLGTPQCITLPRTPHQAREGEDPP